MTGASVLARVLAGSGVVTAFAGPGGARSLAESLAGERIRVVSARDAHAAARAAEGWSLARGRTGVGVVGGVAGLAGALPVAVSAAGAGTQLLLIAAVPPDEARLLAGPAGSLHAITDARRIARDVAAALTTARMRRGPVVLAVSPVLLEEPCDAAAEPARRPLPPVADVGALDRLAEAVARAERPVLLAGAGAFWSGAGDALRGLSEMAGLPVLTAGAARGILPDAHEHCAGGAGPAVPGDAVREVLGRADLVVAIGCDVPGLFPRAARARVDADSVRAAAGDGVAAIGDESATLAALVGRLAGRAGGTWLKEVRAAADDDAAAQHALAQAGPLSPGALSRALVAAAPGAATFAVDPGRAEALRCLPATGAGRSLCPPEPGGAIPYAIAARLARPEEPAIAVTDEAGFLRAAAEIDTAASAEAPVVVLVLNGSGRRLGTMATALGGWGERVEAARDLEPALRRAFDAGVPAVVDVVGAG